MRQKGFAPVIVLSVIAVLGVIGYMGYSRGYFNFDQPKATPTPNNTSFDTFPAFSTTDINVSGWRSYSDTKYLYEFKYPQELKVKKGCAGISTYCGLDPNSAHVQPVNQNIKTYDDQKSMVMLEIGLYNDQYLNNNSMCTYAYKAFQSQGKPAFEGIDLVIPDPKYYKENNDFFNITGREYIKKDVLGGQVLIKNLILIPKQNPEVSCISFDYYIPLESESVFKPIFDQIVSTFRFK